MHIQSSTKASSLLALSRDKPATTQSPIEQPAVATSGKETATATPLTGLTGSPLASSTLRHLVNQQEAANETTSAQGVDEGDAVNVKDLLNKNDLKLLNALGVVMDPETGAFSQSDGSPITEDQGTIVVSIAGARGGQKDGINVPLDEQITPDQFRTLTERVTFLDGHSMDPRLVAKGLEYLSNLTSTPET